MSRFPVYDCAMSSIRAANRISHLLSAHSHISTRDDVAEIISEEMHGEEVVALLERIKRAHIPTGDMLEIIAIDEIACALLAKLDA